MSEPIDDKSFEEYLGRESQLSKRYRALGTDEVPAELDSLVLAQARQAVAPKSANSRKKPAWMRWTPPLALAASMVLVISIVIESGTQHELTMRDMAATLPQSAPEQPAAASDKSAKPNSAASAAEPRQLSAIEPDRSLAVPQTEAPEMQARERADAASRDPVIAESQKFVMPPAEIALNAPAPTSHDQAAAVAAEIQPPAMKIEVPTPAAVVTAAKISNAAKVKREAIAAVEREARDLDEIIVTANRVQVARGPGQGAGPRGTVTTPPPAVESPAASQEELLQKARESQPQRWLEYIRELRRENKDAQADREWRNFLKAYPDYKVDEKDVARAKQ